MTDRWYRCCHWLCARIYFQRIAIIHPERLPAAGPVLYVVLHRNGAVDGFVYHQFIPRGVFLVSTQLLRNPFLHLYFCGIAVTRSKDRDDGTDNEAALRQCSDLLAAAGALIVFPEGTSSLGPHHLPFKSGAARIALDALARGIDFRIIPLAIHYEQAWAFRSNVEVVVGEPVAPTLLDNLGDMARLREMKRRITAALESVGTNFPTADDQQLAERLAYTATLGSRHRYFDCLKQLEKSAPAWLLEKLRGFDQVLAGRRVARHQGVPLFPAAPWLLYAAALTLLGLPTLVGLLLNLPPLLAAWFAARKFADDRNVIALWRILVGLPVFAAWFAGVICALAWTAAWPWLAAYAVCTAWALLAWYRVRKLAVAVWNGLVHRDLLIPARDLHQAVLQAFSSPS